MRLPASDVRSPSARRRHTETPLMMSWRTKGGRPSFVPAANCCRQVHKRPPSWHIELERWICSYHAPGSVVAARQVLGIHDTTPSTS